MGKHTYFPDSDEETTCPEQVATTCPDIMSSLPNHLIMRIIKEADGGLNTHKSKYSNVMGELTNICEDGGDTHSIRHFYNVIDDFGGQFIAAEIWADQLSHVLFDVNRNEQNGIPAPDGLWDETPHDEYIIASTRTF
jgi:hypothetical protein